MTVPCHGGLRDLTSGHYQQIAEISENAEKCLQVEYRVDEASCSTPRRRAINLPSATSIEELRTPAFEELLKSFWESKSTALKQVNGEAKQCPGVFESPQAQALRDSRAPLTAIN